jgi:hypothetical protein
VKKSEMFAFWGVSLVTRRPCASSDSVSGVEGMACLVFSSSASATFSFTEAFLLAYSIVAEPARDAVLIPRRLHTCVGTTMSSASVLGSAWILNAAKVRNAERISAVQEISCSLERDILFRLSIRQPDHKPMTPRPIKTNKRPKSAMMSSQDASRQVPKFSPPDAKRGKSRQIATIAATKKERPAVCPKRHLVDLSAASPDETRSTTSPAFRVAAEISSRM